MVEFAPTDEPESQRRRSTRLVQSVPITVEGVDALGQSFKERTSTLMINCHGCKFLSKHYVLKGSWLILETPHAQAGREPLRVRAQVEWVQRPRTIKELFQIGVELEIPGNVWGIAFPPADWFPYPEEPLPEIPSAAVRKPAETMPAAQSPPPAAEEKLHTMPRPTAIPLGPPTPPFAPPPVAAAPPPAPSAPAAVPQLDHLLAEARQQVQKIVRETARTVASAETNQLLQELSKQLEQAAQKAVENATRETTDQIIRGAILRIDEVRKTSSTEMQQQWSAQFERSLSEATGQLATRFQEISTPLHDNFRERIESDLASAAARTDEVARQAKELEGTLNVHLAEAEARLAELRKEMNAAAATVQSTTEVRVREFEESTRQLTKATEDALARAIAEAQARLTELQKEIEFTTEIAHASGQAKIRTLEESAQNLPREASDLLRTALQDARVHLTELRREMDAAAEALRSISDERRRELAEASQKLSQEATASLAGQLAQWRQQLESDMAVAGMEWNSMLEEAVRRGTERATTQLVQAAGATLASTGKDLHSRAGEARQSLEEAAATIQQSSQTLLATMRQELERAGASLEEINRATSRVEEYAARVQSVSREAAQELERRSAEILEARAAELTRHADRAFADLGQRAEAASAEMARRADGLSSETLERLRPQLESTAQQFLAQLTAQAEQQMAPQLTRASEVAEKLATTWQQAERELEVHRTRLREAAEEQLRASLGQMQASSEDLRKSFAESGRADLEKWLKELDEKGTEATHTTFESLYKAAEWYQKKAQTAMQSALDRITEESGDKLREQAAEISRIFAGELDHRSRSYVEHTQGMLEETARELAEKTRSQFDELKDTRMASFDDQAHHLAQGMLDSMGEAADRMFKEKVARVSAEFEQRVAGHMERASTAAQQELEASLLAVLDAWRVEREMQMQALRQHLGQSSNESIEAFKLRLENTSNAWLAASMATLQARAQSTMMMFGTSTEEKVREAVAKALASLADTMRERLLSLSTQLSPPKPEEPK